MKKLLIALIALLSFAFIKTEKVEAKFIYSPKQAAINEGEVIDDDVWITGETILINGTVNGDVYAAGGIIRCDGIINGDLIAAGGTITVSGVIKDDVRIAGATITVAGAYIGDNLNIFGGTVQVDKETQVRGSTVIGGGSSQVAATIDRNLLVGSGNFSFDGAVGKDLEIGAGQINLGKESRISGNLNYYSDSEENVSFLNQGTVSGQINKVIPEKISELEKKGQIIEKIRSRSPNTGKAFFKILSFISTFLIGLLLFKLLPKTLREVVYTLKASPAKSALIGGLVLILSPVVLLIFFTTILGAPLAVFGIVAITVSTYLAKIFVSFWLGLAVAEYFAKRKKSRSSTLELKILPFIAALALYYLVSCVPFLGFFVCLAVSFFGVGAMSISLAKQVTNQRTKTKNRPTGLSKNA